MISVSEIPDGKADTVIDDIDQQFKKLRRIADQLGISNSSTLNWSMICPSTSDSASTQKRINDLLEQRKEEDCKVLPNANQERLEIVRIFCAMHLGVNLRKAFVAGNTKRVLIHLYTSSVNYLAHMALLSMQLVVFSFKIINSVNVITMNCIIKHVLISLFLAKLVVGTLSLHIMQQRLFS